MAEPITDSTDPAVIAAIVWDTLPMPETLIRRLADCAFFALNACGDAAPDSLVHDVSLALWGLLIDARIAARERAESAPVPPPKVIVSYRDAIPASAGPELVALFHVARIALAGTGRDDRHGRMVWAAIDYCARHGLPAAARTAAYLQACAAVDHPTIN